MPGTDGSKEVRGRDTNQEDRAEELHAKMRRLEKENRELKDQIKLLTEQRTVPSPTCTVPSLTYPVGDYCPDAAKTEKFSGCFRIPVGHSLVFDQARKWFLVRHEYAALHKELCEIHEKKDWYARCVLITGNPGIGKTVALEDLLRRELQFKGKTVRFHHVMCVTERGIVHFTLHGHGTKSRRWTAVKYALKHAEDLVFPSESGEKMLVLHDLKSTNSSLKFQGGLVANLVDGFELTAVFASSPDEENTKDVRKKFNAANEFYSNCWSRDECRELYLRIHSGDETGFDERYYVTGGVVRHVEARLVSVKEGMRRSLTKLSFDDMLKQRSHNESHKVVMGVASKDKRELLAMDFVSDYAMELWADKFGQSMANHYRDLYRTIDAAALRTNDVFKKLALTVLRQPFTANLQLLPTPGGPKAFSKLSKRLVKGPLVRTEAATVVRLHGMNAANVKFVEGQTTLYAPIANQFPFVDFLLVNADRTVDLFQSTEEATHPPTCSTVSSVLNHLSKNKLKATRLIWIGPPQKGVQTWQELEADVVNPTIRDAYNELLQFRWELS